MIYGSIYQDNFSQTFIIRPVMKTKTMKIILFLILIKLIYKISLDISNQNNLETQIDKTKPADVFKEFSDIFLDPNSISLLKLIVPPRPSTDCDINSLPSAPAYLIEENNDFCVRNSPVRFPLPTVFEESEENGSIQDSIFSNGTHSRASFKEEIVSLSRRSSFTLAPSPNLNGIQTHTKVETNLNFSSFCNFSNSVTHTLSSLSQKSFQHENDSIKLTNFDGVEFDENYYDNLPLPEPPPDSQLLISNPTIFCNFSQMVNFIFHQEYFESIPEFYHMLPTSLNQFIIYDVLIEILQYNLNMKLNQSISNSVLFSNVFQYSVDIFINEDFSRKFNENLDNIYFDGKLDDIDNPISDALPVNLMGTILSPFDEEDSCLSDISDNALPIGNTILNDKFWQKNSFIYPTEKFTFLHENLPEFFNLIKAFQQISCKDIISIELKNQYSRIMKEITTSEISEVSDTSQWLSIDDKINNHFNEEHLDDQSFINSFSDIPKSSSSNIIQAIHVINGQEIRRTNNLKVNQHNLIFQNNIESELIELIPLSYEMVVDLLQESKYNESDKNFGQAKLLSWESKNCPESLESNSFPEPPSETVESPFEINLCNNRSDIHIEYMSQDPNKNKILYKSKNPTMKLLKRNIDTEFYHINFNENNLHRMGAYLRYYESTKKLMRLTDRKTIFTFRANCSPIMSYKTLDSTYYSNNNKLQNQDSKFIEASYKRNTLLQLKSSVYDKKSTCSKEMVQCKDVLDLTFKECSKSSNTLTENIFNDFSRPIKFSHSKSQRKRRSYSQSHVYDYQSIQTPMFSKQNSLECLKGSIDKFDDFQMKKTEGQLNKKEYAKTFNFKLLNNNKTVSFFGDKLTYNSNFSSYQNSFSKNHLIRDKIVTNVNGECESYFTSDIEPERDNNHMHHNDSDHAEKFSQIYVLGEGLSKAFVNLPAEIQINTNGQGIEGISLAIEGPSKTKIETTNLTDGNCKVVYFPQSPGDYILTIQQYDEHINGSPFKITVKPSEIDKAIVTAISTSKTAYAEGQGLTDAIIDFPNQFNIYTKDAGPGGLSLSIEGPSKAIIEFKDAKNGVCGVTYRVTEPGLYNCIIKFNRKHIKGSPFAINLNPKRTIESKSNEIPTKLEQFRQMFQIGKKSIFKTKLNKINLDPKIIWLAFLYSPSGDKKEIYVNYDYKNNIIWSEFVPNEIGVHWLSFTYEFDKHLPINYDTSFQIIVEEIDNFDFSKFHRELESIKVFGKGLVRGRSGTSNSFQIEIGESVGGALNVTVDGPSKVEIKCNETEKGFRFSYIPAIQGDYLVTIKYGGEYQIKGSPFQVKILSVQNTMTTTKKRIPSPMSQASNTEFSTITNISDLLSILCYGSGLSKARLYTWMDFYVDASKNKINHLLVGILGPSEPCEEIRILYIENNRYLVSYKPKEKGKHIIIIKWGDTHLCCSPVEIYVE